MLRYCSLISLRLLAVCVAVFSLAAPPLWSQSTEGAVSITVTDPAGAMIPNARLDLRKVATNDLRTATTQESGMYRFVGLDSGSYALTVTKEGFSKAVVESVVVEVARVTDVVVQLKLGTTTTVVEVSASAAPVLEMSSNMIGSTLDLRQIENLPLGGRDLTQLSRLAPGYTGNGTNGSWNGGSSVAQGNNVDGVIASPSRMKFTGNSTPSISPRIENIEEMTVQTDQLDMDQGFGQATMQINFITKSGTNTFHGMLYEDFRNSALNANTWANNQTGTPRAPLILNDFGGSVGGPILKNKLFFFGSFGMSKQPGSNLASNMVVTASAQAGNFAYTGTDGTARSVNVLNLARGFNSSLPSSVNSTIASEFAAINKSLQFGSVSPSADPNLQFINWLLPSPNTNYYPAGSIDYHATENLRFHFSLNQRKNVQPTSGQPMFPGPDFANQAAGFKSNAATYSLGIDYTVSPTVVNQFKAGFLYNAVWNPWNQGAPIWNTSIGTVGWNFNNVDWPYGGNMSGNQYNLPISNYYPVITISDSVSWVRDKHQLKFGFSGYQEHDMYWNAPAGITNYNLGLANGDPALGAFTNGESGTLPNASSSQLAQAEQLYAVLTGRIHDAGGQYGLDPKTKKYLQVPGSTYNLNELMRAWGLFAQDSWRVTPNLTINLGLRWDFTGDNHDLSGAYHNALPADIYGPSGVGNLFQPGNLPGTMNPNITARPHLYNGWKVSPQPMAGFAWRPDFKDGTLGKVAGSGTVIRGGFSMRRFTEPQQYFWNEATDYGALYFQQYSLAANTTGVAGTFAPGSLSLGDPLPPFTYSPHATYEVTSPLSEYTFTSLNYNGNIVNGMNPKIAQPYTQSWNIGIQRELGPSRVLEVRYNGSRSRNLWLSKNVNEVNIFQSGNGFLQQFKAAQQNLAINQQHGVTSFANNGYSGQVALPLFDAAFAGESAGGAGIPLSDYGAGNFVNFLNTGQAGAMANVLAGIGGPVPYFCNLVGSGFTPCATNAGYTGAGAGYPINYFQANPFSAGMQVQYMDSIGYSNYHALQVDLRQRQWHGIQFDANYTWSHTLGVASPNDWEAASSQYTVRDLGLNYGPTLFDTRHVVHMAATVDLPFGKGRRWLNRGGIVDHVFGGWTIGNILTFQTGKPAPILGGYQTFNDYGDGGVVFNGITGKNLQNSVGVSQVAGATYVNMLGSQYLGAGGANSTYLTPNTNPGTIGQIFYLYGPHQTFNDSSLSKYIAITERVRFSLQAEFLNVFNHPTFGWRGNLSSQNNVQSSNFGTGVMATGASCTAGTPSCGARQIELRANIQF